MDDLDRRILQKLQYEFPLEERPYNVLAEKMGIEADELWDRVKKLIASGMIRRMGASLDSRKLGYSSTLAAISVGAEQVDEASDLVGSYVEVTHSYLRDGDFNIWFTVIACDDGEISRILEQIRGKLLLEPGKIMNLPMKRLFKLDARFSQKTDVD